MTMSVQELAVHMGISKPKAYELVRSKGFPTIQVGRRIVVPTDGFKRWLARQAGEEGGG
jgi:excisionase family DNA binding protein